MSRKFQGASRAVMAACLISAAPLGAQAFAQQTQPPEDDTGVSEVVITGSLIRGAKEDGPVAVDVYSAAELTERGQPNMLEFTRSLTSSSQAFGEADIDLAGTASGLVTVNLRGLGQTRTLTLLNGHRTSVDVSFIPTNAIGRVEVLKDGAGVTYGAGAVAGVINFVTRDRFTGVELEASHKAYDGSSGEQDISALFGIGNDRVNVMFSAMYSHTGQLNFTKRDYGVLPYEVNPTQYIGFSAQPGSYITPSGRVNDYTSASCLAMGGVQPNGTAECFYYYTPMFNFVDKQKNLRLFLSGDLDVSDNMKLHVEVGYSKTDVPEVWAAATLPPIASHRGVMGAAAGCVTTLAMCQYQIPIVNAGVQNPFIAEFYARNRPGTPVPAAGNLYTGFFWEPFALNGNPLFPGGARYESRVSERVGGNVRVKGEFAEGTILSFLKGVSYDYALTAGETRTIVNRRDIIVSRLQDALRGYGGPDCRAVDNTPTDYTSNATYDATVGIQSSTAPGSNGCLWYNPFASAYRTNAINGGTNPSYAGAAFENPLPLVDWLLADKPIEQRDFDFNADAVFSGIVPYLKLPGGEIGWAAGAQYRSTSGRNYSLATGDDGLIVQQQCPYPQPGVVNSYVQAPQQPGQRGCDNTATPGAFWGTGYYQPTTTGQKIESLYAELQLPILKNLDSQLAIRRESYASLSADTYKAAVKWQALKWLALRGSYSTNYAPPPASVTSTDAVVGASYQSRFTTFVPTLTRNIPGIKPEEAVVKNFGVLFNTDRFGKDSAFSASIDYFDFDISGQIVNTSVTTVLNNVAPASNGGVGLNTPLTCNAGLISFVTVAGGCTQGTSIAGDITQVLVYQTNGPGIKTTGFDLGFNYFTPGFGGDISLGGEATLVTKLELSGYSVNGVVFETGGDRLGFSNNSRPGDFSSKLRANMYLGYKIGRQSFRVQMNYTQGVYDELGVSAAYPRSTYGIFPQDYYDFDFHYRLDIPWIKDSELRVSVLNIADADPMPAQLRNGYYSGVGNARGRQVEVAVKKKF